ncbi:hypothetical protein KQX54_003904 [Cotesia glomerata]|uniref:Uncharacterized protein n=1 Tax=Cotesia glomerata TaxID=32391 RepID=A0AAV7I5G8_COTGL|nr:hypothetical protein KQX54_003904 [Cotesia glomerata]
MTLKCGKDVALISGYVYVNTNVNKGTRTYIHRHTALGAGEKRKGCIPINGTASEVVGILSATRFKKTVSDSRMVTPVDIQNKERPYKSARDFYKSEYLQKSRVDGRREVEQSGMVNGSFDRRLMRETSHH